MGLLPGALTRNQNLHFMCEPCELVVSPGSCHLLKGYGDQERVQFPIAHGEGRYQCQADTLSELEQNGQLVLRYGNNPNGSVLDVAGVCNRRGNVLGLMPHPERATDPLLGGVDGQRLLQSLLGRSSPVARSWPALALAQPSTNGLGKPAGPATWHGPLPYVSATVDRRGAWHLG